jgi:hypothetical protein
MRRRAAAFACLLATALQGCATLKQAVGPPAIAQVAPEPPVPLVIPSQTMRAVKGDADAPYPRNFAVTVKSDGTIVFPQHTMGHVQGSQLRIGGDVVLTVRSDGEVEGAALKRRYRFDDSGALLDDRGHGVRLSPDGGVRGVGGEWAYRDVLSWTPDGGGAWDHHGWRTLAVVSLVLIENMLPQAIGADAHEASHAGKDRGLTITIPPPSQWFK